MSEAGDARVTSRLDIGRLFIQNTNEMSIQKPDDLSIQKDVDMSIQKPGEDAADLAKDIASLSPTTKEYLGVLLRSISKGEALIDTDSEGRAQIEYKAAKKLLWDGSNANVISQPKTDLDIQVKVDACLELIGYFKSEKPPSGVVLDKTKISLSPTKEYRLGHEFEKTMRILGSGNSAGDIVVVKDKKTDQEHAYKTMMISYFRKEEIRCWVDMADSGYVPCLYLFKIENNKVCIHMEILHNAKTLRSVIDEHMGEFNQNTDTRSLLKPFSLYVLDGALEAVTNMHSKGWVHNDLHGGNVMVQKSSVGSLGIKVLDFGLAHSLDDQQGLNYRGFKADISEVVRLFSGLYTGLEFNNVWDLQHNWKSKLEEMTELLQMNVNDKRELFCLVDAAMKVVHPDDVEEYRNLVKDKLGDAMGDKQSQESIMKKVVALLFPEEFKPVHAGLAGDTSMNNVDYTDGLRNNQNGDVVDSTSHRDSPRLRNNQNGDVMDSTSYRDSPRDITSPHRDLPGVNLATNQVSDEYMNELRMTLGICLK